MSAMFKLKLMNRTYCTIVLCFFTVCHIAVEPAGADVRSVLGVMSTSERGMDKVVRAKAYKQLFEEELAPEYGGKGAWDRIIAKLAPTIGFNVPGSEYFTIRDVWARFMDHNENRKYFNEGNALVKKDLETIGKLAPSTVKRLMTLRRLIEFPEYLELQIEDRLENFEGLLIARSSGRNEDSYLRNLAGIFVSLKNRRDQIAKVSIKEIFKDAIKTIWIDSVQNHFEGVDPYITEEDGFGVVVQPFLEFEASGTAMSNLYNHLAIEAVAGDAQMAVKSIHANVVQYLFEKGKEGTAEFTYNTSFIDMPYRVRLSGKEYCAKTDPGKLREVMNNYPRIRGKFSPISEPQLMELSRVVHALEEEIGLSLDVEWGVKKGSLYIIQVRPIIGDFEKPLVTLDPALAKKEKIAQTPIALGATGAKGFTGKMVIFGSGTHAKTIREVENNFKSGYIRIQSDAATSVNNCGKTFAKVVVDPVQGSRHAHNINLITDRIDRGEFVYCNGPILKDPLLKNIKFIPYPAFSNVWVSEEYVTYFSGGLQGAFYKGENVIEQQSANVAADNSGNFTYLLNAILSSKNGNIAEAKMEDLINSGFKQFSIDNFDFLMEYVVAPAGDAPDMERFLNRLKAENVEIDDFIKRVTSMLTLLRFPLWSDNRQIAWLEGMESAARSFLKDYRAFVVKKLEDNVGKTERSNKNKGKQPVKPEKLKVLFLEDDEDVLYYLKISIPSIFGENGSKGQYEFFYAENWEDAEKTIKNNDIDLLIMDYQIPLSPGMTEKDTYPFIQRIKHITFFSAFSKDDVIKKEHSSSTPKLPPEISLEDVNFIYKLDLARPGEIIKATRDKQLAEYEMALEDWKKRGGDVDVHPEAAEFDGKTIFVLNHSADAANTLKERIEKKQGEGYRIIAMDSVLQLKQNLRDMSPDIVISDTRVDHKFVMTDVMSMVKIKNSEAQFVFTCREASKLREKFTDPAILGIAQKPFYVQGVLDILDGTFDNKRKAAKQRYVIEEAGRVLASVKKTHTRNDPALIRVWQGYVPPVLQNGFLTRVQKTTRRKAYQVAFDNDIENLVKIASSQTSNENIVTILPSNELSAHQESILRMSGARVIFMNFERQKDLSPDNFVQIGAIISVGITYLNGDDNAFSELYRLLTDKRGPSLLTIERLRKNPTVFQFLLKPAVIRSPELQRLNDLLEQVLASA